MPGAGNSNFLEDASNHQAIPHKAFTHNLNISFGLLDYKMFLSEENMLKRGFLCLIGIVVYASSDVFAE